MDYQKVILLGNTTADVEVKQARSGTECARFSVAVSEGKDKTVFFPVTLFGESVGAAAKVLSKGSRVLVEGALDVNPKSGKFRVLSSTFRRT